MSCPFCRLQIDSGVLLAALERIPDESLAVAKHAMDTLVQVCGGQ